MSQYGCAITLLLCSIASADAALQINQPSTESYDKIAIEWNWETADGQSYQLASEFDALTLAKDKEFLFRLSYALSYPQVAIHTYLRPRLEYALEQINRQLPETSPKLHNIEEALSAPQATEASTLFKEAFRQYQEDAFHFFSLSPCLHPVDISLPCVRPNYSELFYLYKESTRNLAKAFIDSEHSDLPSTIAQMQSWLSTITDTQERVLSFSTPLNVLTDNQADSDEKALLMATLISQIAPEYEMFILYPESSIGSVSPAWLVIDAMSGARGSSIFIEEKEHILISGSDWVMNTIEEKQTPLISERLY